jgi:hypothetical protein
MRIEGLGSAKLVRNGSATRSAANAPSKRWDRRGPDSGQLLNSTLLSVEFILGHVEDSKSDGGLNKDNNRKSISETHAFALVSFGLFLATLGLLS